MWLKILPFKLKIILTTPIQQPKLCVQKQCLLYFKMMYYILTHNLFLNELLTAKWKHNCTVCLCFWCRNKADSCEVINVLGIIVCKSRNRNSFTDSLTALEIEIMTNRFSHVRSFYIFNMSEFMCMSFSFCAFLHILCDKIIIFVM